MGIGLRETSVLQGVSFLRRLGLASFFVLANCPDTRTPFGENVRHLVFAIVLNESRNGDLLQLLTRGLFVDG